MKIGSQRTNKKTYHAIVLGGILRDYAGRPLGPYRLRTACKNEGFNLKVIDYAWIMTDIRLLNLLGRLITNDTLVFGCLLYTSDAADE